MIILFDLPMDFDAIKMKWLISISKYFQDTPKNMETDELKRKLNYSNGLCVYIQGNQDGVSKEYMELSNLIWKDIEKYINISIDKIFEWIKFEKRIRKEYLRIEILDFSDFNYGYKGTWNGFTMIFGIPGDYYYGYMDIIIKFTKDGWPKEMELMFN
jgi:hypothetical protein